MNIFSSSSPDTVYVGSPSKLLHLNARFRHATCNSPSSPADGHPRQRLRSRRARRARRPRLFTLFSPASDDHASAAARRGGPRAHRSSCMYNLQARFDRGRPQPPQPRTTTTAAAAATASVTFSPTHGSYSL